MSRTQKAVNFLKIYFINIDVSYINQKVSELEHKFAVREEEFNTKISELTEKLKASQNLLINQSKPHQSKSKNE